MCLSVLPACMSMYHMCEVPEIQALQCRWKGILAAGSQGVPQSHCKHSTSQLCYRGKFPHCKCNNSVQTGESFPSKPATALLWSALEKSYSSAPLGEVSPETGLQLCSVLAKHHTAQQTSLRDLLGRKNPGSACLPVV